MNVERLLSWGRRRQQGRDLREAQRATAPAARRDARELAAYNPEAQREAAAGALEGFRIYAGEDPTD